MLDRVDGFVRADISDLSMFPDDYFDVVVCYGGALSYVCDQRYKAASELVRVVRPGGVLLISVMSRFGTICNLVRRADRPQGSGGVACLSSCRNGRQSRIPIGRGKHAAPADAYVHEWGTEKSAARLQHVGTLRQ